VACQFREKYRQYSTANLKRNDRPLRPGRRTSMSEVGYLKAKMFHRLGDAIAMELDNEHITDFSVAGMA
jgi:hypothetical protein